MKRLFRPHPWRFPLTPNHVVVALCNSPTIASSLSSTAGPHTLCFFCSLSRRLVRPVLAAPTELFPYPPDVHVRRPRLGMGSRWPHGIRTIQQHVKSAGLMSSLGAADLRLQPWPSSRPSCPTATTKSSCLKSAFFFFNKTAKSTTTFKNGF